MKKISLRLDTLRVESFETAPRAARPGTVLGADAGHSGDTFCGPSCELTQCQAETCGFTCEGTWCGPSCELTQCQAETCGGPRC